MIKPKAWVFSTKTRKYPIDRKYCQNRYKLLMNLLNKKKHKNYGSVSEYSIHMEIKLNPTTWFLHFHVVSSSIDDLRLIRKLWGYQIKYENSISPKDLDYYVSKYTAKTPIFPSEYAMQQYAHTVYKLKMHGFSCKSDNTNIPSNWALLNIPYENNKITYNENCMGYTDWNKTLTDFG